FTPKVPIVAAVLATNSNQVILLTQTLVQSEAYTLAVKGIKDISSRGNTMASTAQLAFTDVLSTTKGLMRQVWYDLPGTTIDDLTNTVKNPRWPNTPDLVQPIDLVGALRTYGDDFGERITGFLVVTQSGSYTFYLASADSSQLWFGTDANTNNKTLVAFER